MPELPARYIRFPNGATVRVGALAGSDAPHPHLPDGHTGTQCLACFGWCNDARHVRHASGFAVVVTR